MISISIIVLFVPFLNGLELSTENLNEIFGSRICIPGSLSSIHIPPDPTLTKTNELGEKVLNISEVKVDVSNSLTRLNELAQFNDLKYYFKLEKEEGPAHNKEFTLSLVLGEERFEGRAKSLKKAKQNVAALALLNTQYESPPIKEKNKHLGNLPPMVLLNNLSTKLGIPVEYELVDKERQVLSESPPNTSEKSRKSYFQKLNDSLDSSGLHIKKDLPQDKGPFQIKVKMGDHIFYGVAHSIKAAKHEAASNALDYLIKNKDSLDLPCQKEGFEEQCKQARQNMKSPVSLVYEEAQLRKVNVEFEIVDEYGPAHKKTFVTQCILGDLTATGEGHSKKESKRKAAESMLERLPELAPVSQEAQVNSMMKDKKKKNKKKKNKEIIKTKLEEIGMMAGDLFDSVLGIGNEDKHKSLDAGDTPDTPQHKPNQHGNQKHSYQEEILELSNSLNFEIQYNDFSEENKYYSVLSLLIDPEYICFGKGLGEKMARDHAAHGALKVLFELGLHDRFQDAQHTTFERDLKHNIDVLLKEDVTREKDEL